MLSAGNAGIYLPYSLRGAMYGNFTFPVDGEYEFRLRIANFRGDDGRYHRRRASAAGAEERRKLFEAAQARAGESGCCSAGTAGARRQAADAAVGRGASLRPKN